MNEWQAPRRLGATDLVVGRLGVSGGYGAPAKAFEMAFERGCNYFYHGSRRSPGMHDAIRNLVAQGQRDKLVVVAQVYARFGWQFRASFASFLKALRLERADVLLLGWWNAPPSPKLLAVCGELKAKGLVRYLAVSGHNRPLFPKLAAAGGIDLFHLRYNAAHRGAEREVFARLPADRPGVVAYTATRWGRLLDRNRMPADTPTPRASDCYRFVLTQPRVDVCMTGPKNLAEMEEALQTLARGPLADDELAWMRRVGDYIHAQPMAAPAALGRWFADRAKN